MKKTKAKKLSQVQSAPKLATESIEINNYNPRILYFLFLFIFFLFFPILSAAFDTGIINNELEFAVRVSCAQS